VFAFLFGPDKVDFVSLEDALITFRCRKLYQVGSTIRIKTEVPTGTTSHTLQIPVNVRSVRRLESTKEFIVCGDVPSRSNPLEAVRQFIHTIDPDEYKGARRRPRYKFSLRTLSKDFPGFRALSIDFNSLGLQVETEGPLPEGKLVSLDLEIGKADRPQLLCQAIVRWCRPIERKRFLVGLEFVGLAEELTAELASFEELLVARANDDIGRKSIGFGELGEFHLPSYELKTPTSEVTTSDTPPPPPVSM
jgi:hypothetical protein